MREVTYRRGVVFERRGQRTTGRYWAWLVRGGHLWAGLARRAGLWLRQRDSLCAGGGGGCGGWAERRCAGRPGWRRPGAAGGCVRGGAHRAGTAERLRGSRERGAGKTEVTARSWPGGAASVAVLGLGPGGSDPLWIPGAGGGARGGTWAAPCSRRTGQHLVPKPLSVS